MMASMVVSIIVLGYDSANDMIPHAMGFSFIEIRFSREDKKIQKCTTTQQRATLTRTTIVTTQRLDGYLLDFIYTVQK